MDVYRLIARDHREIDELLSRVGRAPEESDFDRRGREYLLHRLTSVASRHEAAEELTFWPAVRRRIRDGDALADQAVEAERSARALLDLLRFADSEQALVTECGRLHALVRDHMAFEEGAVFPSMRKRTTWVWAALAGVRFRAARRVGPTRPHPGGPDRPFGLMTVGAAAAALDHLRDRARRRPVGFEGSDRTDAVAVLAEDHARIRRLLDQLNRGRGSDDSALHEVVRVLSVHDSIERQHLYPVVRVRLTDGPALEGDLLAEHGEIARLAAKLDGYRFDDAARSSWVGEMATRVQAHIEREEATVLPALAARLTDEELVDLGQRLEAARGKAPTRPHGHVAGVGLGARLTRRALRPLDRARDALSGRKPN